MSKKDYELIARALRAAHYRATGDGSVKCIEIVANLIADGLESDNPRFDRQQFLQAALDN